MNYYDYQVDVWATGCMLAGMLFQKDPFFKGDDNHDQLIKIAKVLGTQDVYDYVNKFDLKLAKEIEDKMQNFQKKPWEKYQGSQNEHLINSN